MTNDQQPLCRRQLGDSSCRLPKGHPGADQDRGHWAPSTHFHVSELSEAIALISSIAEEQDEDALARISALADPFTRPRALDDELGRPDSSASMEELSLYIARVREVRQRETTAYSQRSYEDAMNKARQEATR